MGNASGIIEYEFQAPNKHEFRNIFLKYALMPYGILLLLIPAYFQFKTLLVFTPLLVISPFQVVIYFYLKAKFNEKNSEKFHEKNSETEKWLYKGRKPTLDPNEFHAPYFPSNNNNNNK